jgi:hypothetical protein
MNREERCAMEGCDKPVTPWGGWEYCNPMHNPEVKARHRKAMNDPDVKARHRKAINDPDVKARHRKALKELWKDPDVKARYRKAVNRPEVRAKMSKTSKEINNRPEVKAKISKTSKEYMNRPEVRAANSKRHKELWQDPSYRAKMCGPNAFSWRGGISCEPYCPNWTQDYKELIRARDGDRCMNPDCNGTVKRICVHHIDYDKKNCCPSNNITICMSCNSRANKNRSWHTKYYQGILTQTYGYQYDRDGNATPETAWMMPELPN